MVLLDASNGSLQVPLPSLWPRLGFQAKRPRKLRPSGTEPPLRFASCKGSFVELGESGSVGRLGFLGFLRKFGFRVKAQGFRAFQGSGLFVPGPLPKVRV